MKKQDKVVLVVFVFFLLILVVIFLCSTSMKIILNRKNI